MKKLLTVLLAFMAFQAMAQTKPSLDFTAPPFNPNAIAIPDDAYDGTLASMACFNVTGPTGVISDMSATLAIDHTWIGDLVIKVVAPDNTVLTLMNRPGFAEPADDGTGGFGDSSDLSVAAPINFANGAPTSAEDMGATIPGGDVVCTADGLCDYAPAPGAGPGTDFSDFIGMNAAGTWQICVGDAGGGDTGQIDETLSTLNFTVAIPAMPVFTPPAGTPITMDGSTGPANGSVNIGNDPAATLNIDSINCTFSGPDASEFTLITPMPAGPVAPGASVNIDFTASPGAGDNFNATLSCTVVSGGNTNVVDWPVSAFGAAAIIPSLNWMGLLLMALAMVVLAGYSRRWLMTRR